jgi:hypothetical protein
MKHYSQVIWFMLLNENGARGFLVPLPRDWCPVPDCLTVPGLLVMLPLLPLRHTVGGSHRATTADATGMSGCNSKGAANAAPVLIVFHGINPSARASCSYSKADN